jgi:hypothetical protein
MPLATVRPCPGVSDHLRTTTGVWVLYGYAQPSTSVAPIRAPWTRAPCAPGPPAGPVPPPPYVPAFPVRGEGWNMRGRSPKFWRTARPGSTSARDSRDRGVPGVSRLFGGKTAGHSVAGTAGTAGTASRWGPGSIAFSQPVAEDDLLIGRRSSCGFVGVSSSTALQRRSRPSCSPERADTRGRLCRFLPVSDRPSPPLRSR